MVKDVQCGENKKKKGIKDLNELGYVGLGSDPYCI